MSLQKLMNELAFDSFANELRSELNASGVELNYRYFDEPQDLACLHIGLDNDYALVQIVFWEGGKLELISIPPDEDQKARTSEYKDAGRKTLQTLVRKSLAWLHNRQPADSLHSP